jgi:hypothetical protein
MDMPQYELLVLVSHFFVFLADSSITKMEFFVLGNYVHA